MACYHGANQNLTLFTAAETKVTFGRTMIGWDGFSVSAYSACLQNPVPHVNVYFWVFAFLPLNNRHYLFGSHFLNFMIFSKIYI
jgi:hypothetical protein